MVGDGSRSPLLLVVIALIAAGAIVFVLFGGDEGETPAHSGGRDGDALPDEEPLEDGLEAAPLAGRGSGDAPGERGASTVDPEPEKAPTHVIRGVVTQRKGGPLPGVTVVAKALREYGWLDGSVEPISATSDAEGRYQIDVSAFFEREKPPTQLQAFFDSADHVVHRVKLVVADAKRRGDDGPLALAVDAVLDPAIAIEGVVHDAGAKPLRDVNVFLLTRSERGFQTNTIDEPLKHDQAKTAADGAFRLRAPRPGRYYVAALSKPHLPEGAPIEVDFDTNPDRMEFTLHLGRTISGRVTVNGKPLAGMRVEAENRQAHEEEFNLGWRYVYLRDGRMHPGETSADTDKDGRFTIVGLDDAVREVAPKWAGTLRIWSDLLRAARKNVEAGTTNVELEIGGIETEVRPVSRGELVEGAWVIVSRSDRYDQRMQTTKTRAAHFVLPPEMTFDVEVSHERFEKLERKMTLPAAGTAHQEVLDLGAPKARATLVVTLKDAQGQPVKRADIQVVHREAKTSFGFDMKDVMTSADGVYRIEGLEPGPHSVVVRPGRSSMEFIGNYLTLREDVDLAAHQDASLSLVAKQGSRLRVSVRDEEGNLISCEAKLRDARGEEVHVAYVTGGDNFATMAQGGPGSASPSMVEPPLEAGEYELELSNTGFETKRVTVKAKAGETTEVEVTLRKL